MRTLLLVRANKTRGGAHWSDDDYDVREARDRAHHAAPAGAGGPALVLDHHRPRISTVSRRSRLQFEP